MKTLKFSAFFTLMASLMLCFISCSKDNDNPFDPSPDSEGDYIEVNFKGKKYTEKCHPNYYVQYDHAGYADGDIPLTFTGNAEVLFDKYGFEFMYGLVHYADRSKLKNSAKTSYKVEYNGSVDNYQYNLSFVPLLEIDDVDAELISGSHSVQNIKQVGNNIVITGSYDCMMDLEGEHLRINGKYQMTIPFY